MLPAWFDELRSRVHRALWVDEPPPGWRGVPIWVVRTLVLVVRGFDKRELFVRAGALTYTSVLSIIPFFAVMLAVFKGIGGMETVSEGVKNFLLKRLAPDTAPEAVQTIQDLITKMNATAIGIVGFAALLYTSISLLTTIETSFNVIWGVRRPRSLIRRVTVYWTFLTLSPLLVAASIAASGFVQSHGAYQWLVQHVPFLNAAVLSLAPIVFTWAVFAAFYIILPNAHVSWKAALMGAFLAALGWEVLKYFYVLYNTKFVGTREIYGALGAIPVFLLWIYLSWVIVLFGAELVFALQHWRTYRSEIGVANLSLVFRERLALRLMIEIGRNFLAGQEPARAPVLARRIGSPIRACNDMLDSLVEHRLIREVGDRDRRYVPTADLDRITVRHIVDAVRTSGETPSLGPDDAVSARADRLVREIEVSLDQMTLRALLTETPPPQG